MKIRKKGVIWVIAIVAVLVVGFLVLRSKKEKTEYLTQEVIEETIAQTVSSTGTLVSESKIGLNFEISGRIQTINVKVGDKIAKGEILAVIEDNILNQEVTKARLALNQAVATAGANDDAVREAKQGVENAEDQEKETEDLENQKVDAAEQGYDNAVDYHEDALDYYDKIESTKGADSSEAKSAKLTLTTALNGKKVAEEAVETAKKVRDLNMTVVENSLDTAKERLKTTRSIYTQRSRDATVESARANYAIATANLAKSVLKSPVSGTITKINYKAGEVLGMSSSATAFGEVISQDFILESYIPESDIVKLKLGQVAEIALDAFSSKEKLQAEIVEIEPSSTVLQDVVYYKIKLRLNTLTSYLKEGMSADVDIQIIQKANVLVAPERAVNEGKVKVLLDNGGIKQALVETGIRGDNGKVEIISGLAEGEEVVLAEKDGKK
ncbi:MAG: HlyD family efflux transporter periplasmic adaptor subunit [Patescibacteria group bacterium]|nr:HlyD family efflux transporter periplasmic adaptor subunit [Patescibacteria group bacterium]